ncbi:MAG TPA: lipoyl(octanoyl) transferase LipB [Polyangia bacterium]
MWCWLGRVHHDRTTALQEGLREAITRGEAPETLLLCEHVPVVTLGRRGRPEHLLVSREEFARRGIDLRSVSRGGEATYHGPGQLVAYPVVRLRRGVLAHVQAMAAAVIDVLADYGIAGQWRRDLPGVWVGDAKICALGIHVRAGIAIHGLAFNVTLPPDAFAPIVPCGQPGAAVASLHSLLGVGAASAAEEALSPARLAPVLATRLAHHLEVQLQQRSADAALVQFPDCKTDRHR